MTKVFNPAFIIIPFLMFLFYPSLLYASSSGADTFYDSPGLDPNRVTEGIADFEHIDPYTGGLTLNFVDMRLPGNGGLDLVIQRTYNSKNACREWSETSGGGSTVLSCQNTNIDQGQSSWVGMGWSLHMGRVIVSSTSPKYVIEMPDGSQHAAYLKTGEANKYITKDYWILDASTASSYVLTFTDGKKMTFGQNYGGNVYYATKIEDTNGNAITITYNTYSSGHESEYEGTIKSITDSASRTTSFTLTSSKIGGRYRLSKITRPDSKTITFSYTEKSSGLSAILDSVKPPEGNSWSFSYGTSIYELTKITTPYGGSIDYQYAKNGFDYYVSGSKCQSNFRTVSQKTTSGVTNTGTWNFYYFEGTYKNETRITDPCSRTIKYKHYGYNSGLTAGYIWELGLPISKETLQGTVSEETVTYSWTKSASISSDNYSGPTCGSSTLKDSYAVYVPYLSSQSITRDSKTYTTSYSGHDSYGNPGTISESGDKTRTTTKEYWYNTTKNIVHDKPSKETVSGGFSGSFTSNYTYDTNTGNLTQLKKYGVTTDYTYYSNGNLYTVTDANSNKTTYVWSYGRISKITNPVYSISRTINSIGTIASETNGRNNTTSFAYDGNLRLTSIDPPVGNTTTYTYSTDGKTKTETRGSFYTYYYFDGLGRPSGTKDSIGVTTDITYKSCGLKDYTDSNIGDKTSFDNFGRVTTILHEDSNKITYSYSGSDVTVTDEAGNKTYLYYNAFGNPDEKLLVSEKDPHLISYLRVIPQPMITTSSEASQASHREV
ncbi:MAG: RHS repeat protein [Nitrospirae bacterium]|nr:RHS repeat protein [Nitrospirota bacterium]